MAQQAEATREYYCPEEIAERLRITTQTLRDWVAAGNFPRPIRFGPRSSRWKVEVVEEFLTRREAAAQAEV